MAILILEVWFFMGGKFKVWGICRKLGPIDGVALNTIYYREYGDAAIILTPLSPNLE